MVLIRWILAILLGVFVSLIVLTYFKYVGSKVFPNFYTSLQNKEGIEAYWLGMTFFIGLRNGLTTYFFIRATIRVIRNSKTYFASLLNNFVKSATSGFLFIYINWFFKNELPLDYLLRVLIEAVSILVGGYLAYSSIKEKEEMKIFLSTQRGLELKKQQDDLFKRL